MKREPGTAQKRDAFGIHTTFFIVGSIWAQCNHSPQSAPSQQHKSRQKSQPSRRAAMVQFPLRLGLPNKAPHLQTRVRIIVAVLTVTVAFLTSAHLNGLDLDLDSSTTSPNNAPFSSSYEPSHSVDTRSLMRHWQDKSQDIADQMKPFANPSVQSPFVFFHQRKSGGSSLRSIVFDHAKEGKFSPRWIPCMEPRNCVPYSLPPLQKQAVYASHFNYGTLLHVMREKMRAEVTEQFNLSKGTSINIHSLDDKEEFGSCLTNIRSTVSRVVSCWNYRMVQEFRPRLPPVNELSAQDLAYLLPNAYSKYSEGCNNEILRIFGRTADETYINTITPDHPLFSFEFDTAAKHMSKCVIVMPERCEDSNKIINHFFPWIGHVDLCTKHLNSSRLKGANKTSLAENVTRVILETNQMDELLFQFGESLFDAQLRVANSDNV